MNTPVQPTKNALLLFVLAALLTFGFITALQFAPLPWFFLALIAMHSGVALFIISKRRFKKLELEVSRYYKFQYILLIPYVLAMIHSFAAKANLAPLFANEKTVSVLIYSLLCAFVTVWNYLRLRKDLMQQTPDEGIRVFRRRIKP